MEIWAIAGCCLFVVYLTVESLRERRAAQSRRHRRRRSDHHREHGLEVFFGSRQPARAGERVRARAVEPSTE